MNIYFIYNIFIYFFNLTLFKLNIIDENNYYDRILTIIKNEGITFIKLCQIVSSRPDLKNKISSTLKKKIEDMQDKCFLNEYEYINDKDIYYINKKPIASGAICDIHLIYYNNRKQILKTAKKDINKIIDKSFNNILLLKKILYYYNYNYYKNLDVIDLNEYYQYLINQTRMDIESNNTKIFYELFKFTDNIIIPEIKYYDNQKIIMSYEKGIKFNVLKDNNPEYIEQALFLIIIFFYKSIRASIFHGDFHLGNFLFRIDNNKLKMIVLDFGVIIKLNKYEKDILSNFKLDLNIDKEKLYNDFLVFNSKFNYLRNIDKKKIFKMDMDILNENIFIKVPIKYLGLLSSAGILKELFLYLKTNNIKGSLYIKFMSYLNDNNLLNI